MKWKQKQVSGQPDNIERITKEALITNLQTKSLERYNNNWKNHAIVILLSMTMLP
jgi:hypothetical protein